MRKPGEKPWVRLRHIYGESVVPSDSAAVMARACNRAVAVGDVSRNARWQLIEFMSANYLNDQRVQRAFYRGEPVDPRPVESAVSPAALAERLTQVYNALSGDPEVMRDEADELLTEVLRSLGYEEAMEIYDTMLHRFA